jgi:ribosomal protein S27E
MEVVMDNKYALGSTKVAYGHHDAKLKSTKPPLLCRFCGHEQLTFNPTMNDHRCLGCGEHQNDIPQGYPTGRSADY